ncbi:serine O-acetyltransferase [Simiduia agarivorans]|uniref:Serine acetyltransferase n=1 Tax=Simiduia agarivorans (strain DSM 21679 / JCM 13881 / BCRC 17597 / SA1) TaxID=1117647 RepID=K4KHP4_SIMAS|nr:serine O-acetyltransferase [Simiduia agarivorans]AFU98639.1 serine acetyltransferase [Simiduia agarivorans SA1 = DSM 21679]
MDNSAVWAKMQEEARVFCRAEPALASFYHASVLAHPALSGALSYTLAEKLHSADLPSLLLRQLFTEAYEASPALVDACVRDVLACIERDPACHHYTMPLLFFKGFQALQCYRAAHWLWQQGRKAMALFFQNQIAQTFDVDIHPAARLGAGILMDHATGIVIGETAVVGDDVSMLHGVTLGGSGYSKGDRHPKIGPGVLISAQAKLLGNITVGEGAKIAGGSVVLASVPAHTTVAGVPAKPVGRPASPAPAREMNHHTGDESA